jgi:putative membrane-bound dehydrogenase-like protein
MMNPPLARQAYCWLALIGVFMLSLPSASRAQSDNTPGLVDLPQVPDGFGVSLFARDPLVRNPCSMTFDARGRLCVGMGPQYRNPKPETPGDSVVLVLDTDGDGVADKTHVFASGFNAIQGMAWHGRDLWVANAPDLTVVRDLDGDDTADEYVRIYTDLGNIEHGLHGLNWGPDGKLYMSKGNSKGLNLPDRFAPKPFRDLWGIQTPPGAKDYPEPKAFTRSEYKNTYQDPDDDWGRQGGVLRCDDMGRNLEIVSRGMRNPWDITFDDSFNWLGTDNDQSDGDRVFSPFFGSDFGWSHAWSTSWTGDGHLPTTPISGPVFAGSGTGVTYCDTPQFPESFRGVFLINDWLLKRTYLYRPRWEGAWMQPANGRYENFVLGEHALYRPTDLEIGPDGAVYCLGWGRGYGVEWDETHQMTNEGRVFRIFWKTNPSVRWQSPHRNQPHSRWNLQELVDDLASHVSTWRVNAQDELVRRGPVAAPVLMKRLEQTTLSTREMTWYAWTLGRLQPDNLEQSQWFAKAATSPTHPENLRIQSIRILAHRIRQNSSHRTLPPPILDLLESPEPRIRFEAVQAIGQARQTNAIPKLQEAASTETDRITFYAIWNVLARLASPSELRSLLRHSQAGVRRSGLLALAHLEELTEGDARPLLEDPDGKTASIASLWLSSRHANPLILMEPPPGIFASEVLLDIRPTIKPGEVRYTLDRTEPAPTSMGGGKVRIKQTTTIKARLFLRGEPIGPTTEVTYEIGPPQKPLANALVPRTSPTSLAAALAAIPAADATRGSELFFAPNGPGCSLCHRVGNRGNPFGPDLTGIGSRAEPRHLAQSILDPNAVITEGFNAHVVETSDAQYSGMLLEETGTVLKLALATGQRLNIEKRSITRHETLNISAMPGFSDILSPEQVADLTTWLRSQKSTESASAPVSPKAQSSNPQFHAETKSDRVAITHGNAPVADFVFSDPKIFRPYFASVFSPDGIQVTRNHPPIAGKDATDHDTMHPGIWLGFGDINGSDFWRNRARIEHLEFVQTPVTKPDRVQFSTRSRLWTTNGSPLCLLTNQILILHQPTHRLILWDATFHADTVDVVFGDQEEMGFGARVASLITEKQGGQLTSSDGRRGAKSTWGQAFEWCDYAGISGQHRVGITLMASPQNFRGSWWHNRDYGVFVANPFGREAMRQGSKSQFTIQRGDSLRLIFGAAIHSGPIGTTPDSKGIYREFKDATQTLRASP